MKTILLVIGFPFFLWMFHSIQPPLEHAVQEETFDTTQVAGYSFFVRQGIEFGHSSNIPLYNAIYPLIGLPHRSRNSRQGLDCSGLVRRIYAEAFEIPLGGSSRDIHRLATEVKREELQEGDLVFFRINSQTINHVGIYLGNDRFVHASSSQGVEINLLSNAYYQRWYYTSARLNL